MSEQDAPKEGLQRLPEQYEGHDGRNPSVGQARGERQTGDEEDPDVEAAEAEREAAREDRDEGAHEPMKHQGDVS